MTRRLLAVVLAASALTGCADGTIDRAAEELVLAVEEPAQPSPGATTRASTEASAPPDAPFRPPPGTEPGVVARVVDGDTLVVELRTGEAERVRLLRIDTPELARDGDVAECLADEATVQLERFAGPGTEVLLATDVEIRDRFDRLLAHLWRSDDGVWVNGGMLATGYATVVTFPPNTRYDREVLALQEVARDRGLGLWSRCSRR